MPAESARERLQGNPSIFVLTIPAQHDVDRMKRVMVHFLGDGGGSPLYPIGGGQYMLSRVVQKRLRAARDSNAELLAWFKTQQGVSAAEIMHGRDAVLRMDAQLAQLSEETISEPAGAGAARTYRPTWNLEMIGAPDAWAMMGGLDQPHFAWATPDLRVASLDTGIVRHPCMPFVEQGRGTVHVESGENFFDAAKYGPLPLDPQLRTGTPGHGTRILSVACGYERGRFAGVAPGAHAVPFRVSASVVINTLVNMDTGLADAIAAAHRRQNCAVMNISLGDPCLPQKRVGRAIDGAYEDGVIIVAAAGNVTSEVTYPGRHRRTVTAGGVSRDRRPWSGGSFGPRVDVSAPAEDIYRAVFSRDPNAVTGYSEKNAIGTSYAAAHLSGAALLWLAYHGTALDARYGKTWRRVEAFRHCLKVSAIPGLDWDAGRYGAGILNIPGLLREPLPDPDALLYIDDKAENDLI